MKIMNIPAFCLLLTVLLLPGLSPAAEESAQADLRSGWKISVGGGLVVAPAFSGARSYSLLAVPDLRVSYDNLLFITVRDGIRYVAFERNGWRVGPLLSYTFRRSEKNGGSLFRIAGGDTNALQGMGDVDGAVSLGGFVEYALKPYKIQLNLHKAVTGHEGFFAEARASYGGMLSAAGHRLAYAVGPHLKYGDSAYTNAYWGITPEQSDRSGLDQYHAGSGITSYGLNGFVMMPLTHGISLSLIGGYDRLAPVAADSPLVRIRGSADQAMGGVLVNYSF